MRHLQTRCVGTARSILITFASLLCLVACGGGSGTDAVTTPDSGTPNPGSGSGSESPTGCDTGAIEGGGMHKMSGVVAEIDSGGHLVVGRTTFATNGASIIVDGKPASLANLHKGDVVTVTGAIDTAQETGCAKAVYADADIIGPVRRVDTAARSLDLLSLTIQLRVDTVLADANGTPFVLASLQPGDTVRVSGVSSDGVIVATRVERVPSAESYFVNGPISRLDEASQQFWINGIGVQYDTAVITGFPGGQLHEGDPVRLSGTDVTSNLLRPDAIQYIDYDTPVSVFPATAAVEFGGSVQFRAFLSSAGQDVAWSVLDADGRSCSVTDCGSIDATGLYTAPAVVHVAPGLLVRATPVAKPKSSVTVSVFVHAPPGGFAVIPTSATLAAGSSQSFSVYTATGSPLGNRPKVSWSVAGTGCAGAACGVIDADGNYRAPAILPDPAAVTVTAHDAVKSGVYGSATVSLGANPNLARLQGRYAFTLTGFDGDGHMMVIGSIVANGAGQITRGVEYVNGQLGFSKFAPVTGRYSINGDNRGYMQFELPVTGVGSLTLALADVVDDVARTVRVTSHFANRVFVGTMRRQNEADFSRSLLAGDYAFGLEGEGNANTFHLAAAGRFTITGGQLTEGQIDHADGGSLMPPVAAITGGLASEVDDNGEVRLQVSIASLPEVTQFIGFIVSAGEVLLMQADPRSTWKVPGLSGSKLQQRGVPFDQGAFSGEGVTCFSGFGYPPFLAHNHSAGDGRLSRVGLTIDDFVGLLESSETGTYAVAANGRATLGFGPYFRQERLYFIEPGKAFVIDSGSLAAILYPKVLAASTLNGEYVLSSLPASMDWWISATSAVLTANPSGSLVGSLDGEVSGRSFTGSYTPEDGALRLLLARENEMPMESRFLLLSDSFGLGITTGDTFYQDGCRVIER